MGGGIADESDTQWEKRENKFAIWTNQHVRSSIPTSSMCWLCGSATAGGSSRPHRKHAVCAVAQMIVSLTRFPFRLNTTRRRSNVYAESQRCSKSCKEERIRLRCARGAIPGCTEYQCVRLVLVSPSCARKIDRFAESSLFAPLCSGGFRGAYPF